MSKFQNLPNYAHGSEDHIGVLITNLGTPSAPTVSAIREYLAEFLWDPRVVEIPRPIWWLILHGLVLRTRPKVKVKDYESIWTNEGSPLLVIGNQLRDALQAEVNQIHNQSVIVELAMRYGQPSIASTLEKFKQKSVRKILIFPLYPQYSASTTASTFDAVAKELMQQRWMPEIRMINSYASDNGYISACAEHIKNYWEINSKSQMLVFSFHGLPKRNLELGDPYHCECHQTARLIAEKLNLKRNEWKLTFQSRFGRAEWLQPYTIKTMELLPKEGVKTIDVFCPGFSADCIETLEEINMENRNVFLENGGESFNYISALNAEPSHIDALLNIIQRNIQGWENSSLQDKQRSKERAIEMGAKR